MPGLLPALELLPQRGDLQHVLVVKAQVADVAAVARLRRTVAGALQLGDGLSQAGPASLGFGRERRCRAAATGAAGHPQGTALGAQHCDEWAQGLGNSARPAR